MTRSVRVDAMPITEERALVAFHLSPIQSSVLSAITRRSSRTWLAALALGTLVGVVLGALAGGAVYLNRNADPTSSAQIRVTPPVDLVAMVTGAPIDFTQSHISDYVAGEVAYLDGAGFARAVNERLGRPGPAHLTITQNGTSQVLTISSTGATDRESMATVRTALNLYDQRLRQLTDRQLDSALAALDERIKAIRATRDVGRLIEAQQLRSNVELQAAQPTGMQVLNSPLTDPSVGSDRWPLGALFGGLLGGLLALVAMGVYRSRSGRVVAVTDIADAVDDILTPEVSLRRTESEAAQRHLARTLFAQCPGVTPNRVVAVIGASASSGSGLVASLLETAAAEQGPTALVTLAQDSLTLPTGSEHDRTLILDIGALGDSPLAIQAIAAATDVILVTRLNVDSVAAVAAVRAATASSAVPLRAVVTYWPMFTFGRATKTRRVTPQHVSADAAVRDGADPALEAAATP
ncbi:hypothetical protein [Mycolicibacterium litorale]|uniref:hypothetical protein n=1 Tax=Mycolicibacterium litorale TaxID=758802 RepID=UPI001627FC5F|nr:hypothetical protein [Mycolicibacterium litorale]